MYDLFKIVIKDLHMFNDTSIPIRTRDFKHAKWSITTVLFLQGIRSGLFQVRGCDILIHGVLPTHCVPYVEPGPNKQSTTEALHASLTMMRQGGLDVACEYLINSSHSLNF